MSDNIPKVKWWEIVVGKKYKDKNRAALLEYITRQQIEDFGDKFIKGELSLTWEEVHKIDIFLTKWGYFNNVIPFVYLGYDDEGVEERSFVLEDIPETHEDYRPPTPKEVVEVLEKSTNIIEGGLASLVLPKYANEQECIDAILNGSVNVLPWQVDARGKMYVEAPIVAGHIYAQPQTKGPQPAPIMVIGKLPRPADLEDENGDALAYPSCFNIGSHAGQYFLDTAKEFHTDPTTWYVTYLFKCLHPEDANRGSRLRAPWLRESTSILKYEISQVGPEYILVFGAEALKALFGNKAKITELTGTILEYNYVDYNGHDRAAKCVACTSPHAVIRSSDVEEEAKYRAAFDLFVDLIKGQLTENRNEVYEHVVVDDIEKWNRLLTRIEAECENNLIAIDAEWNGSHPQDSNAWLRTIQFSWKPNTAAALIVRNNDGSDVFSEKDLTQIKSDFFNKIWLKYIIAGHYLDSDTEFLVGEGYVPQLWDLPYIPSSGDEYRVCCKNGIACLFDTAMAAHAYEETANHSLTGQYLLRCPSAPRYDTVMDEWKKAYCKEHNIKEKELDGYGHCPDDTIVYYGCYDADVTRRLAIWYIEHLEADVYGLNCWDAFSNSMQQWPVFLEMNCTGLYVDRDRMDDLMDLYSKKCKLLLAKIRRDTAWPGLNINSSYQLRELLFGEEYHFAKAEGCLRPAGALSLRCTPLYSTNKGVPWDKAIREDGELAVPACNARSLTMLSAQYRDKFRESNDPKDEFRAQLLKDLRSYKILAKVLSYVLKEALVDDDDGERVEQGLSAYICDDGKLRTHLYMTLDSGRSASARPALQNISKRREADYKEIVGGDKYIAPLRSILCAPEGHMIVSADFLGAELMMGAVLSGDEVMLDHVTRNQLPEDDPNFYDIHSGVAVNGFKLTCEPTKAGLKSVGKVHLRVVAKSIIFGIMYGRSAKAIVEAVKEEGVYVSLQEVEQLTNGLKQLYPQMMDYLREASNRVYAPGYVIGIDGRYRRVPKHNYLPTDKLRALERVFCNYPLQNGVAAAMREGLTNLYYYRFDHDVDYRICLQVHDEVVLTVPYKYVTKVVDEVLPECMSIRLFPRKLDGTLITDRGPYTMGTDVSVGFKYGVGEKDWREIINDANIGTGRGYTN